MAAALFAIITVIFIIFIIWRFTRLRHWMRRTYSPATAIPFDLIERLPPSLKLEDFKNDPSNAIGCLADIVTKQNTKIEALNTILQNIDEGVLLTDSNTEISFVNQSLLKMLDSPDAGNWVGRDVQGLIRTPPLIRLLKAVDDTCAQDNHIRVTQNDREMDVTVRKMDGFDDGRFLLIFRDVSTIVRSGQTARDLIANVAHQLRTPLTSIKGYAETLLDQGSIDKEISRRFLTVILKNADRLTGLVRDILILAQLDGADGLKDAQTVRFKDVILKAADVVAPAATGHGIKFVTEFPKRDILVKGSPSGIEQAVVNLLDNAVKYTGGGAAITIVLKEHNGDAVLSVSDHGPGIPSEALDKVFERFYRLERDRTGGTGLGLSIVRQTAQVHKGRAWAESQLGKGSTFYIAIPIFLSESSNT